MTIMFFSIALNSYAQTNNGLVAWWTFDDGISNPSSTTAADSTGNGNTGTLVNSPSWVTGKYGDALSFNGTNQYVSTTYTPPNIFSISMWFQVQANDLTDYNRGLLSTFNTGGGVNYNGLYVGGTTCGGVSGSMHFFYDGNACTNITFTFNAGNWYFLTVTSSGSQISVYVNGTLTNTVSSTTTHKAALTIGQSRFNNIYWNGIIDEVRVYNRALTAGEVYELFESGGSNHLGEIF